MTEKGNDAMLGAEGRAEVELRLATEIHASYVEQAEVEAQPDLDDPPEGRKGART